MMSIRKDCKQKQGGSCTCTHINPRKFQIVSHSLSKVHEPIITTPATWSCGSSTFIISSMYCWNGASQLLLRANNAAMKLEGEKLVLDKPSGIDTKWNSGWSSWLGELNWGCAMAIEKPLEYRIVASWSTGFMWPWNGYTTSTYRWPSLLAPCFSIDDHFAACGKLRQSFCFVFQIAID